LAASFLFTASAGGFATFIAIRRALSRVSSLADDRRLGQRHFFPHILQVFFQYRRFDWHGRIRVLLCHWYASRRLAAIEIGRAAI
jgi:hypothetical protein